MKALKAITALMILTASSLAMAEGGSDRLYGKMIPPGVRLVVASVDLSKR